MPEIVTRVGTLDDVDGSIWDDLEVVRSFARNVGDNLDNASQSSIF